ncbi:hypothetical protein AG1IA_06353 [Rhizoctonia solani AG-1 IA]|uniref:Uncharacterized protein n=1 Tax=Thanatephorus cucumeris (strain AG1-IA) TaxID=983506 RepID=L8WS96_THACA|nr:hypothetical protein AG1IA_06353 [Rhizoctonia solani AG-1 IA]
MPYSNTRVPTDPFQLYYTIRHKSYHFKLRKAHAIFANFLPRLAVRGSSARAVSVSLPQEMVCPKCGSPNESLILIDISVSSYDKPPDYGMQASRLTRGLSADRVHSWSLVCTAVGIMP